MKKLQKILYTLPKLSWKYSKLTLFAYLIFLFLLILNFKSIKIIFTVSDMINSNYETYESLKTLEDQFHTKNSLLITYANKDGLKKYELCELDLFLQDLSRNEQELGSIASPTRIRATHISNKEIGFKLMFPIYDCDLNRNQQIITPNSPWKGINYSASGQDISFEIQVPAKTEDNIYGTFNFELIDHLKKSFDKFLVDKNLKGKFYWSGNGFFQYFMKLGMDKQTALNILSIVLMLLFFLITFGSLKGGLLLCILLIPTYTLLYALFSIFKFPVDLLTQSLFIILMLSACEDFFFLSYLSKKNNSILENLKRIIVPSFFTSITTVIGFTSLGISKIDTISQYGIMTAIGAIIEWFVIFTFLPAFIKEVPYFNNWATKQLFPKLKLKKLLKYIPPRSVSFMLLLAYPCAFYFMSNAHIQDAIDNLFKSGHPITQSTQYIKDARGWKSEISLLFKKPVDNDRKKEILSEIRNLSEISHIEDLAEIENFLIEPIKNNESHKNFVKTTFDNNVHYERLNSEFYLRSTLYLNKVSTDKIEDFRRKVEAMCKSDCFLSADIVSYSEFAQKVSTTLIQSLAISLLIVGLLLLYLATRQTTLIDGIYIVLSSLWGPMVICCLMGFLEVQFNHATCIFGAVLVGLAGDNAIQFLFQGKDVDSGIDSCFYSSVSLMVCSFLLIVPFFLGSFETIKTLGLIFAGGTFCSLIGDIWIYKGLKKR